MPQLLATWPKPPRAPQFDFAKLGVTDGQVWLLVAGSDYSVKEATLVRHLRRYGAEEGFSVETQTKRVRGKDGRSKVEGVAVRFTKRNATPEVAP